MLMIAVRACGVILITALLLDSAAAQLFDPPRPPGSVPTRPGQAQPTQPGSAAQPSPGAQLLAPTPLNRIQGEDLPPPGGSPSAAAPRGANAPASPQPQPSAPGQRQQRAGLPPNAAAPGSATPAPPPSPPPQEDVVTLPPAQKIVNPTAVFSGLDKITGRITAFDAAIGETVQFGALQVTARACYSRPPTETPLTDGFVEVAEVTLQGEVRRIFTGWMFAASPGLHAVEHPIYDVWLTDCKGGAALAEAQPPPPQPARAATPPQRGAPQQRAPAPGLAPRQNGATNTLAQPGGFR